MLDRLCPDGYAVMSETGKQQRNKQKGEKDTFTRGCGWCHTGHTRHSFLVSYDSTRTSDTSMTNIWKYSGAEQFGVWSVVRARQVTLEKRTDVCSAFPAVVTSSWVTAGGLILDERAAVSRQWLGVTGEEIPEPRGGRMTDVHRWCRPCTSWGNTHLQSFQKTQRIQAKFFNKMTQQLFASFTDFRLTLPVF